MCHVIEPDVKVSFLYLTMPACFVKPKNQLVRYINIPSYVLLRAHDLPSPSMAHVATGRKNFEKLLLNNIKKFLILNFFLTLKRF